MWQSNPNKDMGIVIKSTGENCHLFFRYQKKSSQVHSGTGLKSVAFTGLVVKLKERLFNEKFHQILTGKVTKSWALPPGVTWTDRKLYIGRAVRS